jgi:hypothetical protein
MLKLDLIEIGVYPFTHGLLFVTSLIRLHNRTATVLHSYDYNQIMCVPGQVSIFQRKQEMKKEHP